MCHYQFKYLETTNYFNLLEEPTNHNVRLGALNFLLIFNFYLVAGMVGLNILKYGYNLP